MLSPGCLKGSGYMALRDETQTSCKEAVLAAAQYPTDTYRAHVSSLRVPGYQENFTVISGGLSCRRTVEVPNRQILHCCRDLVEGPGLRPQVCAGATDPDVLSSRLALLIEDFKPLPCFMVEQRVYPFRSAENLLACRHVGRPLSVYTRALRCSSQSPSELEIA